MIWSDRQVARARFETAQRSSCRIGACSIPMKRQDPPIMVCSPSRVMKLTGKNFRHLQVNCFAIFRSQCRFVPVNGRLESPRSCLGIPLFFGAVESATRQQKRERENNRNEQCASHVQSLDS